MTSAECLQFTEVLNYLLHEQKNGKSYLWQEIQDLVLGATNDVDRRLAGYVLEAQRLAVHVPLIRQIPLENGNPGSILTEDENQKDTALKAGDMLLLDIVCVFPTSSRFSSTHCSSSTYSITAQSTAELQ